MCVCVCDVYIRDVAYAHRIAHTTRSRSDTTRTHTLTYTNLHTQMYTHTHTFIHMQDHTQIRIRIQKKYTYMQGTSRVHTHTRT